MREDTKFLIHYIFIEDTTVQQASKPTPNKRDKNYDLFFLVIKNYDLGNPLLSAYCNAHQISDQ